MKANHRIAFTFIAALFAVPASLDAQTGTYAPFGVGCSGGLGSGPVCASNNTGATQLESLAFTTKTQPAFQVKTSKVLVVGGFEIFTKAKARTTVKAYLYDATTKGIPNKIIATGSITVDTKLGWYAARFSKPTVFRASTTFFLSYEVPGSPFSFPFELPVAKTGTMSPGFVWQAFGTGWNPNPASMRFAWRVTCGAATPALSAPNVPTIGKSFTLNLTQAKGALAAVAVGGFSKTTWAGAKLPVSLAGAGAPGCSILVSVDLTFGMLVVGGNASLSVGIPFDTSLKNFEFHNQWLVIDSSANALGIATSNGGSGKIGG